MCYDSIESCLYDRQSYHIQHIQHIHVVSGVKYITVRNFAQYTNRKEEQIRRLIRQGNSIRRLSAFKHHGFYLIPITELYEYPFVEPGRYGATIKYHRYNRDGSISLLSITS